MSLEQTIDNLQIRNANMVTFVGTSNTMVDTTTGRIQTKGIQHNSNVITDVSGPHGRGVATLKKYPDIIFEKEKFEYNNSSNTYTQAGYTVSVSSQDANLTNDERGIVYYMFDGAGAGPYDNQWTSASASNYSAGTFNNTNAHYQIAATDVDGATIPHGEWIKLKMPKKIRLERVFLQPNLSNMNETPEDFKIYGSNDGTTWKLLITQTGMVPRDAGNDIVPATTISGYYDEYAIVITKIYNNAQPDTSIEELEFYGYEEDPPAGDHSVDTTFKSRFNNAQTTGVQVLVDGATGVGTNQISGGPDPSGNQSTYVTDGKYWTLNGTLTSNLSVEANTFLEGDQPHAVSVWFNSSNLEANVSNTCVFSIASEEKLDSVNLDLQSNTWHNLTYAYQGEGGSRVTYLDGRKVAEDQAEDTFGDYPPFAMTGYSQGGYVVSASSEYGAAYLAHEAFNGTFADNGDCWLCANLLYDSGTGTYNGDANLGSDSGGPAFANADEGEWLKLEMPNKFVLDYITICGSTATGVNPKDWKIYGSNDDKNWDVLLSKTNTIIAAYNASSGKEHVVGASKAYKYFALVVTKSGGLSGDHYIHVAELEFYGHRENDLVRLPDPTNVLKYPHVTLTEDARRGYVVSASGNHSNGNHPTWKAFDGVITNDWQIDGGRYSNSGGVYTHNAGETTVTNVQSRVGDWVQLESPHKIRVKTMKFTPIATYGQERSPATGVLVGSNDDGSTWTEIKVFDVTVDGTPTSYTAASPTTLAIDSGPNSTPGYYKIHRLIWLTLYTASQTTYADRASVADLELYGTGVDSIPIQIGGGNIDKVANFRLYDRFIEEDQVNEIWNAQKEEFGRAKPQMVLQQGKLGIGTDAPQGSLSVADEPHNLEEFPPKAMTGYKNYFEGHGEFCVSASSELSGTYRAWDAFNRTGTSDANDAWLTPQNRYTLNNYIDVDPSVAADINGVYGEWLELKLPYKITLDRFTIKSRAGDPYGQPGGPAAGNVWGSNDGVNWTLLKSFTGLTYGGVARPIGVQENVVVNSTTPYSYFRLQPTKRNGVNGTDGWVGFGELRYFGTREQGQSVLHDGQLTLTKNLNVPRIGPPLGTDDTPRRDRLVVEYNTSSNPTFEGAVRDTSGRGNDGMFRGGAFYSDAEKALVFDGNADYVESPPLGWSGAQQHSVSVWIKLDLMTNPHSTSIQNAWTIVNGGATNRVSHLHIFTNGTIEWAFNGNNATTGSGFIQAGTWYHVVCVYNGGAGNDASSRRMWINGDEKSWNSLGSSSTLNLEPEATFALGYNKQLNNYDHDGSVSNAKLYDVALTSEDVKTLYDMGRMGGKANPQPLHISGPVNVMGDIRYITSRPLALPTMWDHMANGNCAKGVYPIIGRNGGNTIYHVYCEPDWAGGGWMCMAQFAKDGYQVKAHPTNGDLNIFTKGLGDSKNIRWNNTFAVPLNILSLDGNGYDLDVMIVVLGGGYAGRYEGGMRVGSIWRGHQLSVAFNPGTSSHPGASGLASSSDGYTFSTRTPVTNQNYDMINSGGWYYSCAATANYQGSYNDQGLSDGGYILHQGSLNKVGSIYGAYHSDTGVAYNSQGNTDFACVRIFVRPSIY